MEKYFNKILLILFLLSFTMPYVRVGAHGIVWPRIYLDDPSGLPRIIEITVILFFLFQFIFNFRNLMQFIYRDNILKLFILILLYIVLLQYFLSPILVSAPTAKGAIRGNIILPLMVYIAGYYTIRNEKNINLIFFGLILVGLLQAIVMLEPTWFPEYLFFGNLGAYPVHLSTGEIVKLERAAGFWDRSSQAATFMTIQICLGMTWYAHTKSLKFKLFLLFVILIYIVALLSALQRIQVISILFLLILLVFKNPFTSNIRKIKIKYIIILVMLLFIIGSFYYPYIFLSRLNPYSIQEGFLEDYRRLAVWPAYSSFILRNLTVLFFGAGFGCDALDEYGIPMGMAHAHNQFLGWIAGIGLPMTIIVIILLLLSLKRAFIVKGSNFLNSHEKMIASFMVLIWITIMIICLAESPLLQAPISILFFFINGIVSALYYKHLERKRSTLYQTIFGIKNETYKI